MDKIKGIVIWLITVLVIIILPISIFTNFIEWIANAIKWVVFIDNAETGLPIVCEIIIKAIIEGMVLALASYVGISKKNPFATILTILFGFLACLLIFAICKYIVWILISIASILVILITILIINKRKKVVL